MLDDLLELGLDLAGEGAGALLGRPKHGKKGRNARRPAPKTGQDRPAVPGGKVTAQRKKCGEDPWEWKEKRPPWEG